MKGFGSTGPILFPPTEMARMPWGEQDRAGSSGTRHHSKILAGVSGPLHGKPEDECTGLPHNRVNAARPTRSHVRRTRQGAAGDGRRHSATTQTGAGAAAQLWNKDDIRLKTHKTSRPRENRTRPTRKDQQLRTNNADKEPAKGNDHSRAQTAYDTRCKKQHEQQRQRQQPTQVK